MPVRDVLGDGKGIRPIEGDVKLLKVAEEEDPIEKMEQATYRGARYRAFIQASGIQSPGQGITPTRTEEKTSLDVGVIVKALGDQVTNLIGQLTTLATKSPNAPDPLLQHLMDELKETRARLDNAVDPMDAAVQSQTKLTQLAQMMKQALGLPDGLKVGASDLQATIQMKQLEMEQADRRQRWDTDMEERRQQWKREDQRWQEEFRLKKMEFFDGQTRREQSGDLISRLVGNLFENVETEGGGVAQQPGPQSFPCEVCKTAVPIPAGTPSGSQVTCPRCQESYKVETPAA